MPQPTATRSVQRRAAKNRSAVPPHCSAITPPSTSGRWFSARLAEHVEDRAGGTGLGVAGAEDDARDPGQDDRAGAHRAGLEGDVEGGPGRAPAAQVRPACADRQQLGVGGRVEVGFAPLPAAAITARRRARSRRRSGRPRAPSARRACSMREAHACDGSDSARSESTKPATTPVMRC